MPLNLLAIGLKVVICDLFIVAQTNINHFQLNELWLFIVYSFYLTPPLTFTKELTGLTGSKKIVKSSKKLLVNSSVKTHQS